jgi:hypothetical protein
MGAMVNHFMVYPVFDPQIFLGSSTLKSASPSSNEVGPPSSLTYHPPLSNASNLIVLSSMPTHPSILYTHIHPCPLPDRTQMTAELSHTLSAALLTMATHTSSERGRTAVPLITSSSSISPFPMAIAVRVGGVEVG